MIDRYVRLGEGGECPGGGGGRGEGDGEAGQAKGGLPEGRPCQAETAPGPGQAICLALLS